MTKIDQKVAKPTSPAKRLLNESLPVAPNGFVWRISTDVTGPETQYRLALVNLDDDREIMQALLGKEPAILEISTQAFAIKAEYDAQQMVVELVGDYPGSVS